MYRQLNDSEILYMINESDDYLEILIKKYRPIILKICSKYLKIANKCGYELDDLIQIANISLIDSIKHYKDSKNILFYTYVIKSIENNIKTELKKELTNHKKMLNISLSLDQIILGSENNLYDFIEDKKVIDPINYVIIKEKEIEYIKFINKLPFEVAIVFEMKNDGFTTNEISKFLNIDNLTISKYIRYARSRLCLN